jgi:arachidonate 5-lipoxygenase
MGLEILKDKIKFFKKSLRNGTSQVWKYDDYTKDNSLPMPRMVKGIPASEILSPSAVGHMTERLLQLANLGLQYKMGVKINNPIEAMNKNEHNDEIKEVVDYVGKHLRDDVEFCQQLLQGVNPLSIEVVKSIDQIPPALRELKGQDRTVTELISENRLFVLDYKELRDLTLHEDMYFYAPVMVVYKEKTTEGDRLNVLGIQLDPTSKTIFHPGMEHKNRYQLAKWFVASADHQVHEFIYHLGLSHLFIEPIIVAVHNALPTDHPIRVLLEPHFKETIGINFLARQTLVADKYAFTDRTFAIGTKQALKIVSNAWEKYDFVKTSFPEQLKKRGFDCKKSDGLDNYHYRDDGFLLWNAIGEYIQDVVRHFYTEDEAVKKDTILQAWATEMVENAKVTGFPKTLETQKSLTEVLQIIIWNASALHSVVNYPQWSYLSHVQNRPNALYAPMPEEDGNDITEEYLKKALPSRLPTQFQLAFSWLLSMPSSDTLATLSATKSIYPGSEERLKRSLDEVTKAINQRNQKLRSQGKAPYIFLLPSNVATSVNI